LVVLQSEYEGDLGTVIVAPLVYDDNLPSLTQIMVKIDFEGTPLIASIPELAAINRRGLRKRCGKSPRPRG
jgi:hypothetical protein